MLKKISQILYVFLSSLLVVILISLLFKQNIKIDEKIIYLFLFIFIPFLEPLINTIKENSKENNFKINFGNNLFKYLSLIILLIIFYYYGIEKYNLIISIFFIFSLFFKLDSRISFLFALVLLFFTPIFLIISNKEVAELLSINAYYFLIIGVVLEIKENIFQDKKIETNKLEKLKNNFNIKELFINELKAHKVDKNYFNLLNTVKKYFQKTFSKNNLENIIKYIKVNIFNIKSKEDDFSKNLILFSKIIGIIIIYKLIETYWKYFTIKNLLFLLIGIFLLFVLKDLIFNLIKNLFSNRRNNFLEKKEGNKILLLIKINSKKITYLLFIISIILLLLSFKFNLNNILYYSSISTILIYFYSIIIGKKYLKNIQFKEVINREFFINKATFFSVIGVMFSYLIFKNYGLLKLHYSIYIIQFIFFLSIFYFFFYKINKKELIFNNSRLIKSKIIYGNKNLGRNIKRFSPTLFIKNHIYLTLNVVLVLSILIVTGHKNGFFKEVYNNNFNTIKIINFRKLENKIVKYIGNNTVVIIDDPSKTKVIKTFTRKEKLKQAIDNQYIKTKKISGEIKIKKKSENKIIKIKVFEYYKFNNYLRKGYSNNEVSKLKDVLTKLGYFDGKIEDNNFDEDTRLALVETLKKECDWPKTTKGILGRLAQNCINNLEIKIEEKQDTISTEIKTEKLNNTLEEKINIISGEANILEKKELIKVSSYYRFKQALSKSKNKNPEVKKLEEIMKKLGYFDSEPDLIFDEKTRLSLVELLEKECQWPKTTKGILGYKAQLCLYKLKIEKE